MARPCLTPTLRTKQRLGKQRDARAARRVEVVRKLTEASWYRLTRHQPFASTRHPTSGSGGLTTLV